ncbi:hypothetical protein [Gorillibacterium sp. sgz5001074]|uniref:hypothetical protein n=1 Tax=Gorillibacterium sp. sgz5001074 TaxID=3446695 RepID=UPI003F681187
MENRELRDLKTTANGATDLQENRHPNKKVTIEAPESSNPSPVDPRTAYNNK